MRFFRGTHVKKRAYVCVLSVFCGTFFAGGYMKEKAATRFSLKNPSLRMIDSEERNLQYIVCDGENGIVISGLYGMTGLTLEQAKTVCCWCYRKSGITGLNLPGKVAIYKRGEKMQKGTRQYMAGLQSPCKSCMGKNCNYTCEGFS